MTPLKHGKAQTLRSRSLKSVAMRLDQLLQKQNNNFDLLRLLAAGMVVWGHAYAISPTASKEDLISQWVQFEFAGSYAVKLFFFLSGLLVMQSLLTRASMAHFFVLRVTRLMPGLLAVTALCGLVMGPLLTSLSASHYFMQPETWRFILLNAVLKTQYELPGVFGANPTSAVNGSLWTLPVEALCYALVWLSGLLLLSRNRWLCTAVIAAIVLALQIDGAGWMARIHLTPGAASPIAHFMLGAMMALWRDKLVVSARNLSLVGLATISVCQSEWFPLFFVLWANLWAVYLSASQALLKWRLPGDASYGLYLSGFVIQQCLMVWWPQMGPVQNTLLALPMALMYGFLSWHWVEKRAIHWANMKLARKLL